MDVGSLNLVTAPSLDMPAQSRTNQISAHPTCMDSGAKDKLIFREGPCRLAFAHPCMTDRWRLRSQGGASQVQHVLSANCIDAGSEHKPILHLD